MPALGAAGWVDGAGCTSGGATRREREHLTVVGVGADEKFPGAQGVKPSGNEKLPAASGCSRWVLVRTWPVMLATW